MRNNDERFIILEIDPVTFNPLGLENKIQLLNQQYRKLSVLRHPDKNQQNPNAHKEFIRLNDAYTSLKEQLNSDSELLNLPETGVEFNLNDLSFFQQYKINELYNTLLSNIAQADTDEKERLISQNIEFLKLARKINNQSALFNTERVEAFRNYMLRSNFFDLFNRNWRLFVIKTFGKELLDDFSYRNALGTGDFKNILDSDKIFNPFKLLISFFALIECTFFSLNKTLETIILELLHSKIISQLILQCLALGLYYYSPVLFIIFLKSDMIIDWLEKIANPYNQIIKPLAEKLQLSEEVTVCMTLTLSVISVFLFASLVDMLLIVTSIIALVKTAELFYHLYEFSTEAFVLSCIGLLISFTFSQYLEPNSYVEVNNNLINLISILANIALVSKAIHMIKHNNEYLGNIMMNLPLPTKRTNKEFADIINKEHKTAYLSHCYFNTPENAKFKKSEQIEPSRAPARLLLTY